MSQPLISVIVPVYKAMHCLRPCVESILTQGIQELELILVEDGSPDESGKLCDLLASEDARVKAFHIPSLGAAAARSRGLKECGGKYITFVDSDDQLMPGIYKDLLPILTQDSLDWIGFNVQHTSGATRSWPIFGEFSNLRELQDYLTDITVTSGQIALLYNKVYRRELIGDIMFDPRLQINEDLLFNLEVLKNSQKFTLIDTFGYLYEDTSAGSLSRSLRTDLLEAEQFTRPAFAEFLSSCGLALEAAEELCTKRAADVGRLQFFLLTGRKGKISIQKRSALISQCLKIPGCQEYILDQLKKDNNKLLALPYQILVTLRLPFLIATYCAFKEPFIN